MFFGATTLHRSNPVTQGERALLVYWTNVENRDE
jgi:predicted 2-oxoglutarate/Fe(II)-dependent dioxygenase YbiX